MPGTYSQILLHIVFSAKRREPWITADIAARLYPYMGGIVRAEKGVLYDIGGIEDHVHLYLRWRPDHTVSDLMRTVKARSSKWIHDTFADSLHWQVIHNTLPIIRIACLTDELEVLHIYPCGLSLSGIPDCGSIC